MSPVPAPTPEESKDEDMASPRNLAAEFDDDVENMENKANTVGPCGFVASLPNICVIEASAASMMSQSTPLLARSQESY